MNVNVYQKEGLNFVEISNELSLKVVFCDLGASIFNIYFDGELMTRNVRNIKDFKNPKCYYGKTIGRTSNRIKGNKVEINGETYLLENNEGLNVLHGGKSGLSNHRFSFHIDYWLDRTEVVFFYLSKDLEGGYPGNANIEVTYTLYKNLNQLDIKYNASSDKDTLLSLTNHSYFSLGDKDIFHLELKINSEQYLEVNRDDLLPVEVKPLNEVMDFSEFKRIVKDIDSGDLRGKMMKGYDAFFYFGDSKVATLRNDKYLLDILTNFEGLQMYTSNYRPAFKVDNDKQVRDSVALEPSDSFLNPRVLNKDEKYSRFISYTFNKVR